MNKAGFATILGFSLLIAACADKLEGKPDTEQEDIQRDEENQKNEV